MLIAELGIMRCFGIQKAFVWTQTLNGISVPYTAKASHAEYQQSPIWGKIVTHVSIPSFVGYSILVHYEQVFLNDIVQGTRSETSRFHPKSKP